VSDGSSDHLGIIFRFENADAAIDALKHSEVNVIDDIDF
jgi:hypothetical protein